MLSSFSIVQGAQNIIVVVFSTQMQSVSCFQVIGGSFEARFSKNACRRYNQKSLFMWSMWFQRAEGCSIFSMYAILLESPAEMIRIHHMQQWPNMNKRCGEYSL